MARVAFLLFEKLCSGSVPKLPPYQLASLEGKAAERHVLGGFDDGLCLAVEESGDVAEVASSVSVW